MAQGTAPGDASAGATVHVGFIAGHMRRTRRLLLVVVAIVVGLIAGGLVLGGTPEGLGLLTFGAYTIAVAAAWLGWLTADPARMEGLGGIGAWGLMSVGMGGVVAYFGVSSGAMTGPVIAIGFVTQAHDSRLGLVTMVGTIASVGTIAALVLVGRIDDPGLLAMTHLGRGQQLAIMGAQLAMAAVAYAVARVSRQATRATIEDLDQAARVAARRDAVLDEARAELRQLRGLGDPGRFTDQVLGAYRLGVLIGRGAMGEVYEARHEQTGAPAAVKLVRMEALGNRRALARFRREATILANLRAPHVVRVLEVGGDDAPLPFIAMERLHGVDLATLLRAGDGLEHGRLVTLLRQVARGLDAAHDAGVVHRDLKPRNVFCHAGPDGDAWTVIDFGVARHHDDGDTLTAGHVVGTPAYMAPEQATTGTCDARADRYGLAAVAFRVLTGEPPHRRIEGDVGRLIEQAASRTARLPRDVDPHLPAQLDAVFAIGLARDPADRFESCAALADAVEQALVGRLAPRVLARGLELVRRRRRVR